LKSIKFKVSLLQKVGTSILISGVLFHAKYPLPNLPPGGKELASECPEPIFSPLGEIRKGVV
jgi:hypothetical protein